MYRRGRQGAEAATGEAVRGRSSPSGASPIPSPDVCNFSGREDACPVSSQRLAPQGAGQPIRAVRTVRAVRASGRCDRRDRTDGSRGGGHQIEVGPKAVRRRALRPAKPLERKGWPGRPVNARPQGPRPVRPSTAWPAVDTQRGVALRPTTPQFYNSTIQHIDVAVITVHSKSAASRAPS